MDSFDVIKRGAHLPPLAEGDLVLMPDTGAYAWGYTTATEGRTTPVIVALPAELDRRLTAELDCASARPAQV